MDVDCNAYNPVCLNQNITLGLITLFLPDNRKVEAQIIVRIPSIEAVVSSGLKCVGISVYNLCVIANIMHASVNQMTNTVYFPRSPQSPSF